MKLRIKTSILLDEILLEYLCDEARYDVVLLMDKIICNIPWYRIIKKREMISIKYWIQSMLCPYHSLESWVLWNLEQDLTCGIRRYTTLWLSSLINFCIENGD